MRFRRYLLVVLSLCPVCPVLASSTPSPQPSPEAFTARFAAHVGFEQSRNAERLIADNDKPDSENAQASTYLETTLDLDMEHALDAERAWISALALQVMRYQELPELHQEKIDFRLGPALTLAETNLEILLVINQLNLGANDFRRRALGLELNRITHRAGGRGKTTLAWQRQRHEGLDDLYDRDRVTLEHTRIWTPSGPWQPVWSLRGNLQRELNRWHFDDLSSQSAHLELAFQASFQPRWTFISNLGATVTRHAAPAPDQDFTRRDRRLNLALAVTYDLEHGKFARCEAETLRQTANDDLAEARSSRLGCGLEWSF